ncbi:PEP-CTERM sorting domain-containing protein [Microcoleus sp. A006_D1]|uniref:PEP-CTERM sorting domain-containing protein n=1 Tax=Microcoleus sp. A006_D1 TaxID=3055267 RepID=UPI002FD575A0
MPTFFARKFSPSVAGIFLVAAAVISGGKAATASDFHAVSIAPKSSGLENLFLAQVGGPNPGRSSPSPNPGRVIPVSSPVKIPEPSMLGGLGLVVGSLVVTRRKVSRF